MAMGDEHVNATRGWVLAEVKKQMEPLTKAMQVIQGQNAEQTAKIAEQTKILSDHVKVVDDFDHWRKALWGNGTGPKGFLELAREEDKRNINEILKTVSSLKAESYRQEGKTELRKEQEQHKTVKLTRAHIWMAIVATCAGAFGLDTFIKPLVHYLLSLLPH